MIHPCSASSRLKLKTDFSSRMIVKLNYLRPVDIQIFDPYWQICAVNDFRMVFRLKMTILQIVRTVTSIEVGIRSRKKYSVLAKRLRLLE